jgi:phospholipid transport system substrate-binding protein
MTRFAIVGLLFAVVHLYPQPAQAGPATDVVRDTVDKVLAIGKDQSLSEPQRRARIRQIVVSRFGFEEMARGCLGRYWNQRTPAERDEFVKLFTDLLERTYINDIEAYREGQTIQYGAERVEGDEVEVPSTVLTEERDRVPVNYRLLRTPNGWQVHDLVVDGLSLVANYRSQFARIIEQQSYTTLIKKIRAKVHSEEALEHGPGRPTDTLH